MHPKRRNLTSTLYGLHCAAGVGFECGRFLPGDNRTSAWREGTFKVMHHQATRHRLCDNRPVTADLDAAIELLNTHYLAFQVAAEFAARTEHTVPSDTKSYSEILVSLLTGLSGRARQKGSDLEDGSDVKAANVWSAIDTPRFNGCAPAGRTTTIARRPNDITAFDDVPHLFLVLWDNRGVDRIPRCRIWCVSPQVDPEFRRIVATWYEKRRMGEISSDNFQLHPPRNTDSNVIRNTCGNLEYPLLFCAEWDGASFQVLTFDEGVLDYGRAVAV